MRQRRIFSANVTSKRVLAHLAQTPGATASDVARAVGISPSTATYHVGRLLTAGVVASVRFGGRVHCFLPAAKHDAAAMVLERHGRTARVLERFTESPGRGLAEVAADLGMSKSGVHWHAVRLEAAGLVVGVGNGSRRRYRAPPWDAATSASANARAVGNRAAGSLARARATTAPSSG